MRLLIISDMAHHWSGARVVGWGPTVREIDRLAVLFDEVRHVACLESGPAPASMLPYDSPRVEVVPVRRAGGPRWRDKLGVLWRAPGYAATILRELGHADLVHVRCPANIGLVALVLLAVTRRPRRRWVKYAGDWNPAGRRPWTYRLQRWCLNRGLHHGLVTINGRWPGQPAHVHSLLNPCLTDEELEEARGWAKKKTPVEPVRLLYAGRLESGKGPARAVQILARVLRRSGAATLDIAGDGAERHRLALLARRLGVSEQVRFHGWLTRPAMAPLYGRAHFLVFPSRSEGWPKVLSEGMAYGAIPLAGRVSSVPQYLETFRTGRCFDPDDLDGFAETIGWYRDHPEAWRREAEDAVRASRLFTYGKFVEAIRALLKVEGEPVAEREDSKACSVEVR